MNYREYDYFNKDDVEDMADDIYIKESDYIKVIDDIETRISEIYGHIHDIQGLSEIDEVKKLFAKLSGDLY